MFGRDDPMAKWSGTGDNSETTDGFFKLDGYYTGEADPASDPLDKTIVRHIDTKEEVNMKNVTGRTYTHVYGWKYLFSATAPNTSKVGGSGGGTKGRCFQLYDQQQMEFSRGFLIGSLTGHDKDHRARWTESPIGVQFQWTDKNSDRQNNAGFKLYDMWLMFMDTEFGIMQYAPICSASDWQGDVEIIGDDPAEKFWAGDEPGTSIEQVDGQMGGAASRKAATDHNGRVIAYVKDEHVELIRKNKMMCVGFYISTLNGKQNTIR